MIALTFYPYTADCGECGSTGGHEVSDPRNPDGWEDCPKCIRYADCHLCGEVIDCTERRPDELVHEGEAAAVCRPCFNQEPEDES